METPCAPQVQNPTVGTLIGELRDFSSGCRAWTCHHCASEDKQGNGPGHNRGSYQRRLTRVMRLSRVPTSATGMVARGDSERFYRAVDGKKRFKERRDSFFWNRSHPEPDGMWLLHMRRPFGPHRSLALARTRARLNMWVAGRSLARSPGLWPRWKGGALCALAGGAAGAGAQVLDAAIQFACREITRLYFR